MESEKFINDGYKAPEEERGNTRLDLFSRVVEAKKRLPSSGISSVYFHYFKLEPTKKDKSRFSNVLQLRVTDEEITDNLEKLVEHLDNKEV